MVDRKTENPINWGAEVVFRAQATFFVTCVATGDRRYDNCEMKRGGFVVQHRDILAIQHNAIHRLCAIPRIQSYFHARTCSQPWPRTRELLEQIEPFILK
ncbi:hypothetical protein I7I51_05196 [Histoplasma capsulatum]|uniref:Uncharacterized protein n=1 Tax=Ajellomyces capsulatus TaxID=5037 RepID=A0A8A1M1R1_AJECA|nr:hypothetical protein I7I51_05196 [Histoplasma capsulatum]